MDATNDVIIATACNYQWCIFKNYAVSLAQSGFRGRKILFVRNITDVARQTLIKLGFELIDYTQVEGNVVIQRFKLLVDWLEANQENVRFVIQSDVKDVVVQSDPSPWMEKQTAKIFGASEFILYRNEFCNPKWVYKLYGDDGNRLLENQEVVCAGTIAGEAKAMLKLAKRIYESSTDRFGDDQAALNMLLRTEFKDEMIIPPAESGFILTAGWWLIGDVEGNPDKPIGLRSNLRSTPPTLVNGVAYPQGSESPFCIVHQYDRGNAWAPKISDHYQLGFNVSEDQKPYRPEPQRRSGPLKYAKDGLTIDWWDTHVAG
jgi:hypothetical protein